MIIPFGYNNRELASKSLGTDSGAIIGNDASIKLLPFQRLIFTLYEVHLLHPNNGITLGSGTILGSNDGGIMPHLPAIIYISIPFAPTANS